MAKGEKRKVEEDFIDDGGEDAPFKRIAKRISTSDSDSGVLACELSHNRKVYVRTWKGHCLVDIREYYVGKSGPMPGKKGISLTLEQWEVLRDHANEVNEAIKEMGG